MSKKREKRWNLIFSKENGKRRDSKKDKEVGDG
jgi:hypothetical protein